MIEKKPLIISGVIVLLVVGLIVAYVLLQQRAHRKDEEEKESKAKKEKESKENEEKMCRRVVDMYIAPIGTDCLKEHEVEKFDDNRQLCIAYSNTPEKPAVSKVRTSKPERVSIVRSLKGSEEHIKSNPGKPPVQSISYGGCKKDESMAGSIAIGSVQVKLNPNAPVYQIVEKISNDMCITKSKDFQGYRNIKLTKPQIPISKYNDDTCNQQKDGDGDGWKLIGLLESIKNYTADLKTGQFTKLADVDNDEIPTLVCGQPSKCGTKAA